MDEKDDEEKKQQSFHSTDVLEIHGNCGLDVFEKVVAFFHERLLGLVRIKDVQSREFLLFTIGHEREEPIAPSIIGDSVLPQLPVDFKARFGFSSPPGVFSRTSPPLLAKGCLFFGGNFISNPPLGLVFVEDLFYRSDHSCLFSEAWTGTFEPGFQFL
jgi:hypothetical protein